MKINIKRVKHEATGLYCEDIPDAHRHTTYVYLTKDATEPVRICKSRLELAAYLGGWADCKEVKQNTGCSLYGCQKPKGD